MLPFERYSFSNHVRELRPDSVLKVANTNLEELLQYILLIRSITHAPDKIIAISYSWTLRLSPAATRDDKAW